MSSFSQLQTVQQVHLPLIQAAENIYKSIFRNCRIERFGAENKHHLLDKELGIDLRLILDSGTSITVQEKFRDYPAWAKYHEFTQEIYNGDGSDGEWFHLFADWYFYGWGVMPGEAVKNAQFVEWFIIDIVEYKLSIEREGGIYNVGSVQKNNKHGKAQFIAIPYNFIKNAIRFHGTGKTICCRKRQESSFTQPIPFKPVKAA